MKRASTCIASLLALPLATTFASHAAAQFEDDDPIEYNFTVNPTLDLTQAFLFVASPLFIDQVVPLGPFDAGVNQEFSFTDDSFFASENRVVFLSVYEESINNSEPVNGLNVSLIDLGTEFTEDPTFDDLFGEFFNGRDFAGLDDIVSPEGQVTDVESQVIADLQNTPTEDLRFGPAGFFAQGFAFPSFSLDSRPVLGFNDSTSVALGNFSTLTDGGSLDVIVNVIPEPASAALVGLGGLMLAGRRRRVSA